MRRPTARERQLLAVAAAAAAAALVWVLVWTPLMTARERIAGEIAGMRTRLIGNHGLLTKGRGYESEVERLTRSVEEREARLFSGEQASLLGARLQKLYKDKAEASGLTVRSEQILEAESVGDITAIPVEITVGGNAAQLDGFLEAVEQDAKFLLVDRLSVRVPNILRPVQLTATARIVGYLLPEGKP